MKHVVLNILALSFLVLDSLAMAQSPSDNKNVILIIGDGMDDHQITIAR